MAFETSLLWQNDDRWASTTLGYGPQAIKDWGCLTTSLTMVVNGCGYTETPATVSQKMVAIKAFSGAAINAYRIGDAFPGVALKELVDCETSPAPLDRIDSELEAGRPVLVRVDWNAAAGIQDHWVLIYDKDDSDYLMWDPWKYTGDAVGKAIHLTDRYKFSGQTSAEAINSVIFFDITGQAESAPVNPPPGSTTTTTTTTTTTPKTPAPTTSITIVTNTDQVALRGSPSISGPLLRRLPLNSVLTSLEDEDETAGKIGVEGQWLNVKTSDGVQGYVAAWYLTSSEESSESAQAASTPAPAPASAAKPLTVKVIQDQLAFRSSPAVTDNNLIERFPLNTVLTVTDADANQKIGVTNQWLKVKNAGGREGYVAAWYVSK